MTNPALESPPRVDPFVPGTVDTSVRGDAAVVALKGEHDLSTLGAVQAALDDAIARGGGVVVDLAPCAFIDCSVLRVISGAADATTLSILVTDDTSRIVRRLLALLGVRVSVRTSGA